MHTGYAVPLLQNSIALSFRWELCKRYRNLDLLLFCLKKKWNIPERNQFAVASRIVTRGNWVILKICVRRIYFFLTFNILLFIYLFFSNRRYVLYNLFQRDIQDASEERFKTIVTSRALKDCMKIIQRYQDGIRIEDIH